MGAAPTSGQITIEMSYTLVSDPASLSWSLIEIAGVTTTGANGADAIAQSVEGAVTSGTSITATLAAFAKPTNRPAFLIGSTNRSTTLTPTATLVQVNNSASSAAGYPSRATALFNADTANLTPTVTAGTSVGHRRLALEISAA